jgi:hypothetical protein
MSANAKLPLNEPQQRNLTICLAALEKQLRELRERLKRSPRNTRLIHYEDPFGAGEAQALLPTIAEVENRLRRIADELALGEVTNPVRRTVIAGLEVASINLEECRAGAGLGGYGTVAAATADYLDREIPKLGEAIQSLLNLVKQPPSKGRTE